MYDDNGNYNRYGDSSGNSDFDRYGGGYGGNEWQTGRLETLGLYTARVFGWMFLGLLLTAGAAFFATSSPALLNLLFGNYFTFIILMVAEFALVIYLSARITRMQYGTAVFAFLAYSVLNGLTLSVILLVYTYSSVAYTFGITSITFGVMSLYGFITRTDLTRIGNMLFMGVIGLIVLSLINMFMRATAIEWVISILGIFLFLGLTAYDTQKIKQYYYSTIDNLELSRKIAIMGALRLYLDFINLFLSLLRLFGKRR
jgi:FtsH-binding integral membrane protein